MAKNTDYQPPKSIAQMVGTSDHDEVFGRKMKGGPTRLAKIHEQRAMRDRAQAKADRQLRVLSADATERKEDEAYERAMDLISRGDTPDLGTMALALRSRARRDLGPKVSSAEQHAADYQSHSQADNSADIEFTV